jgi:hypothetical protein
VSAWILLAAGAALAASYPLYRVQHWIRCPACAARGAVNYDMLRQALRGRDTRGLAEIKRAGLGECIAGSRR